MTDTTAAIDARVFHEWSSLADFEPYLSSGWREELLRRGDPGGPVSGKSQSLYVDPLGAKAPEAYPEQGAAGSDPDLLIEQLFADGRRSRAVLGYDDGILATAWMLPEAARVIVRAANDWTRDRWLTRDDRVSGLVLIPSSQPAAAAEEIGRWASHPQMVGVEMGANLLGLPFGRDLYDPIYEVASEAGLPIVIGTKTDVAGSLPVRPMAGGLAATFGEFRAMSYQPAMAHMVSMVALGVFERFPTLKVLIAGAGASWLPGLIWKMDFYYKMDHAEHPWLTRFPSEYLRDHVRFTTNGLEMTDPPDRIVRALATVPDVSELFLYGSGYPDASWVEPTDTASRLPSEWSEAVLSRNASDFFRWPAAEAADVRQVMASQGPERI
jgi:predicted TIM-barrel fold metal-dependent hydrolase